MSGVSGAQQDQQSADKSNPNNYSVVSTLQRQDRSPGYLTLFLKLNSACLVKGGTETEGIGALPGSVCASDGASTAMSRLRAEESPFDFLSERPVGVVGSGVRPNVRLFDVASLARTVSRMAKSTQSGIERGVSQMATATRGSRSCETLVVSAHDGEGRCLGQTEPADAPSPPADLAFSVPILVDGTGTPAVVLKLWSRAGPTFILANRRYSLLGCTSPLHLSAGLLHRTRVLQLHSPALPAHASLTLTLLPDLKLPPLAGLGWTLADPLYKTAIFNSPLDQSYMFGTLLATERTSESTVVLPLAYAYTTLILRSLSISLQHSLDLSSRLPNDSSDVDPIQAMQRGYAHCQLHILHLQSDTPGTVQMRLYLQKPNSIFEESIGQGIVPCYQSRCSNIVSIAVPFYPRILPHNDPLLLPGNESRQFHIGAIRVEMREETRNDNNSLMMMDPFYSVVNTTVSVHNNNRLMEAMIQIEPHLNTINSEIGQTPVLDITTGETVGLLAYKLTATTQEGMVDLQTGDPIHSMLQRIAADNTTSTCCEEGGLLSVVGLEPLTEDLYPQKPTAIAGEEQKRKRQIQTMGDFVTFGYLRHHIVTVQSADKKSFTERSERYGASLFGLSETVLLPPDKRRDPRPFRPSSSRMDSLLNGIAFNTHVQSLSITRVREESGDVTYVPDTLFLNVTSGAPADHVRGFGVGEAGGGSPSGGLRRLEAARITAAQRIRSMQDLLIQAVAQYFATQSQQQQQSKKKNTRYISPSVGNISKLRKSIIDATQNLHRLTWDVAMRRANVFSQTLGIAITLYLACVSNSAWTRRWADVCVKHGFLLTFEGMLSAAGKELGMIEDASVGIAMLRMVSVVLVPADSVAVGMTQTTAGSYVPVIDSPYLKWIHLAVVVGSSGSKTQYRLEIGLDRNYYMQRVPLSLRDGTAVRFYPMLYQMGVDIRQWSANAGKKMRSGVVTPAQQQQQQSSNSSIRAISSLSLASDDDTGEEVLDGELLGDDDEDDVVGITDNDVLVALNMEAFRKMNSYAHAVVRQDGGTVSISWEQAHALQQQQQPVHPMLVALFNYIRTSAGKMEHGILDEAATASAKLGGGGVVFCKSGKDRTAMQVTFKQAQFVNRALSYEKLVDDYMNGGRELLLKNRNSNSASSCLVEQQKIMNDATLMRIHGTRLPICEKNVGQALFAFNSLQARFMPEMLKPPPGALAGLFKGGRVFNRETNAIES